MKHIFFPSSGRVDTAILNVRRKSLTATTQECCEQYWTSPGGNTPQSSSCTATYHASRKLSKLEEPDIRGHSWRSRDELISDVLLWAPSQDDQLELTYNSSVPIKDSIDDLPEAMDGIEGCWERVRDIRADPIYQPLRSGRIWHLIFKRSLTGLNSEFSFS